MNLIFSQHLPQHLEEALALDDPVWWKVPGSYSDKVSPFVVNLCIVEFAEVFVSGISCSFTWTVGVEVTLYACQA